MFREARPKNHRWPRKLGVWCTYASTSVAATQAMRAGHRSKTSAPARPPATASHHATRISGLVPAGRVATPTAWTMSAPTATTARKLGRPVRRRSALVPSAAASKSHATAGIVYRSFCQRTCPLKPTMSTQPAICAQSSSATWRVRGTQRAANASAGMRMPNAGTSVKWYSTLRSTSYFTLNR